MKYSFWHTIPIVRLLFPFSVGVGISMFYPISFTLSVFGFFFFLAVSILAKSKMVKYAQRWYFGICINVCLLLGGIALHGYQNEVRLSNHFSKTPKATKILVSITEQPVVKPTSYKTKATVLAIIDSNGKQQPACGSLILYVQKNATSTLIKYGDVCVIPAQSMQAVSAPQNPNEFNYKRYLAFHHIHHQLYVKALEIELTPYKQATILKTWSYSVQAYFKGVLSRCIASANETAVAQALLYGFDDDIDAETVQAYSNTGTLHVLAVSGMHVGIIYMLLLFFLQPFDNIKHGIILKNCIILVALWLYSLLCGLSPSILRATVMFTFILFSVLLKTRSSVYNTLAASALVLLVYDSNMLANVGFQLSYLAVLGIVFFQPIIVSWYNPKSWLMQQIWSITAVSLAAQLITFPIGLLYFHQFPNCFLFSNLIIIPLTTLILYLGIILLLIGKWSWLSWLLGQLLYYLILATNTIVLWVEKIPFAYVNGIHISIFQSILLYGMIGSITAYLILFRKWQLYTFLVLSILFAGLNSYHQLLNYNQQRVVVYHIPKHTAIQLIAGTNAIILADSLLLINNEKMKFHVQQHTWKSGIQTVQKVYTETTDWKTFTLNNTSFLVSGFARFKPVKKYDILILKNTINLSEMEGIRNISRVIISSAVKAEQAKEIISWCNTRNIIAEYVGEKGAIEVSLLK